MYFIFSPISSIISKLSNLSGQLHMYLPNGYLYYIIHLANFHLVIYLTRTWANYQSIHACLSIQISIYIFIFIFVYVNLASYLFITSSYLSRYLSSCKESRGFTKSHFSFKGYLHTRIQCFKNFGEMHNSIFRISTQSLKRIIISQYQQQVFLCKNSH